MENNSDLASQDGKQLHYQVEQEDEDLKYNQEEKQQYGENIVENAENQMRRIKERRQLPSQKDELIQYLATRLQQAEDSITDIQEVVIQEKEQKEQLIQELNEKSEQLKLLLEQENQTLAQKVGAQLKQTLDKAIEQKVMAEMQIDEYKRQMIEREYMIRELEDQNFGLRDDLKQMKIDFEQVLKENQDQKMIEMELKNENENQKQELKKKEDHILNIEEELRDTKAIIDKLGDVRNVLNRLEVEKEYKEKMRDQNRLISLFKNYDGTNQQQGLNPTYDLQYDRNLNKQFDKQQGDQQYSQQQGQFNYERIQQPSQNDHQNFLLQQQLKLQSQSNKNNNYNYDNDIYGLGKKEQSKQNNNFRQSIGQQFQDKDDEDFWYTGGSNEQQKNDINENFLDNLGQNKFQDQSIQQQQEQQYDENQLENVYNRSNIYSNGDQY
ncbi:hypothetical protein PPERSA_12014 [Pseudocohnilembus persalinus]|uniref:Uncharacterized protein n=1 Tax=Pseudocohnilembus persalinus TaxID=266149 RepID=A0A0V0QKH0_PSEPJ|nr:hypothetical protein PPERSA_12014 [Pseudocohnilembus persalinus]|eukprot:KRX02674.1 hypothetical protein PPERSA_12014 [Pseudocohnilembus persalinus]